MRKKRPTDPDTLDDRIDELADRPPALGFLHRLRHRPRWQNVRHCDFPNKQRPKPTLGPDPTANTAPPEARP